jgi:hypothetical protein
MPSLVAYCVQHPQPEQDCDDANARYDHDDYSEQPLPHFVHVRSPPFLFPHRLRCGNPLVVRFWLCTLQILLARKRENSALVHDLAGPERRSPWPEASQRKTRKWTAMLLCRHVMIRGLAGVQSAAVATVTGVPKMSAGFALIGVVVAGASKGRSIERAKRETG